MKSRSRHPYPFVKRWCRLWLIVVWGVVLTPLMAFGQTPAEGRSFVLPAPAESGAEASLPPSTQTIVRGPCDPDYWIISTRCAEAEVEAGVGYNYKVYRFEGPNPGRYSSMDELLASLQPGVPVCFMAHGSFVTWDSMLNDSAQTYRWLRGAAPCQPVHMIFYTWASDDVECFIPGLRVNVLGRRASLNGFYLADLITKVSHQHPVCVIGHSHGTRMVSAALHSMGGGAVEGRFFAGGPQPPRRIRVILAAAAIDHDWLNPNERFGLALNQCEAVINLRNHTDFPLTIYPLRRPISGKALAISSFTRRDRELIGPANQKIVDYDVTNLVGLGHIWVHYYSQPQIAQAIRHFVYFDE
ncbi:hypothetical protein [Schlesneria sp. T3-172]|uniref:hypothetical protein n=1 Tax=Schlesneria sphaerica TaxID=3373610 RepID=UPI0037CB3602